MKGTIDFGQFLTANSDVDWAGCPTTRRTTTEFRTLVGANCISWSSKKQLTFNGSSTEAEDRLMAVTNCRTYLDQDLHIPQSSIHVLYCDNLSALHFSVNPVFHARTKHFVRKQVALKRLETRHVSSTNQFADIFTKSLLQQPFSSILFKLEIVAMPIGAKSFARQSGRDQGQRQCGFWRRGWTSSWELLPSTSSSPQSWTPTMTSTGYKASSVMIASSINAATTTPATLPPTTITSYYSYQLVSLPEPPHPSNFHICNLSS